MVCLRTVDFDPRMALAGKVHPKPGFDRFHLESKPGFVKLLAHGQVGNGDSNYCHKTEFWLLVPSAGLAVRGARVQGLAVKRKRRVAFIDDPDGNIFAFAENR
jgi:hypothetical protein